MAKSVRGMPMASPGAVPVSVLVGMIVLVGHAPPWKPLLFSNADADLQLGEYACAGPKSKTPVSGPSHPPSFGVKPDI
jgi:hypothetical protein